MEIKNQLYIPESENITASGLIESDLDQNSLNRHKIYRDTPLKQKYDNTCHNLNIGVCPEVKYDNPDVLDLGLFSVPPDHPTFEANRHTFNLGVCSPVKYDDPIWESVSKKKTKGSPEEI